MIKMEMKRIKQKINKIRSWWFDKKNEIGKPITKLTQTERRTRVIKSGVFKEHLDIY